LKPERITRVVRNAICWLLASILILLGHVKSAKYESFQDGVITSIYFHNPNRKLFRKIVTWLQRNRYTFISCDQLIEILNGRVTCPPGAVWLSFDDGWKGNLANVLPIALEYNIPVTIFIYTDAIENGSFWWKKAKEHSKQLPPPYRDINVLMKSPEDVRKQVLQLIARAEKLEPFTRDAMTIDDIKSISEMPMMTIGSHTISHPILNNCTDVQTDYELGESRKTLENWTGKPVRAFAYPGGSFSSKDVRFLQKHGYELAVTTENRFARSSDDRYLFPRTDVMDDGSFNENLCHALGVWNPTIGRVKRIIKPNK
jgi:peptidoglycan/xylan/chitin deacetylase (PgdA/CDA1 family)